MNAPPPESGNIPTVVTLKDVYNMVVEVKDTVSGHNLPDIKADVKDHEDRIRQLEKWVWRASGLATLAGAGLSQIITEFIARR